MSEDGFSEASEESVIMEIYVETLTGTSFEMKVESTDTVFSIKNKIQRVEGIPVAHQNLLYKMRELEDCRKLCDVGIVNGSTLKLILTMRGGPISTRRLSVCDHHFVWKDLKELVENSRDEIGEKASSRISLLVFKEGDVINLLRVVENEDGSFVPYNEDSTSPLYKNKPKEENQSSVFEKLVEDHEMLTKMSQLRQRMDDLSLKRQLRQNKSNNTISEDSSGKKLPQFKLLTENDVRTTVGCKNTDDDDAEGEEIALKEKHRSKFISMSPQRTVKNYQIGAGTDGHFHHHHHRVSSSTSSLTDPITVWPDNEADELFGVACNNKLALSAKSRVKLTRLVLSESPDQTNSVTDGIKLEENIQQDIWEINEPSAEQVKKSTCKISLLKRHQSVDCGLEDDRIDGQEADFEIFGKNVFHVPNLMPTSAIPPQYAPKEERMTCQYFVGGTSSSSRRRRSPLYGRKTRLLGSDGDEKSCITRLPKINAKDFENDRPPDRINFWKKNESDSELNPIKLRIVEDTDELTDLLRCDVSQKKSNLEHLPAVNKKRLRCEQCNKRLNITTMYNCRCGKLFCAQHRYSEVHNCKYDYKTEGRKLLEQQNPLVVANKLPKF